jgi:CelD/BcsL family acetyltransferase involved in cellulose biosynthesis
MSDSDLAFRPSARRATADASDLPIIRERLEPVAPFGAEGEPAPSISPSLPDADLRPSEPTHPASISLEVYSDLTAIQQEWRHFAGAADGTAFQTFDWLATWQRHIGTRRGTTPAIVLGRDAAGRLLFILPLAVEARGLVRRLTWLGSDLCDYNAPLLGEGFSRCLGANGFVALWRDIVERLRAGAGLRFDVIDLPKMPESVGGQRNPFLDLPALANPSGAYVAILDRDWDAFYAAKRSSATRKKERKQLKQLGEHGAVRFVDVQDAAGAARTLDTLIGQKERSFARMGVENLFARPGYREFYHDITTNPGTRDLVHVSRLEVGPVVAAANLGLRFRGCYYLILSSYHDGDLSRFGPGRAHLHELLRYAIDCGYRRFDFTIGDEPYKRDWSDIELRLHDHLAAVTTRGRLVVGITAVLRRAKRFIKQTPAIWRAFSKARALAGLVGAR